MNTQPTKQVSQENPFVSLMCNIALPTAALMILSKPEKLGPTNGLIVALSIPAIYWLYYFAKTRKVNFISILGFVSILLTGGLGLMKLDGIWFAVKEASIPALIGLGVLLSMRTRFPFVKKLLYNDQLVHVDLIDRALVEKGATASFDKALQDSTYLVALSFALSASINFAFAYFMLKSPAGTPEFNEELGYMNMVSNPVIIIICTALLMLALWRLVKQIRELTGLELDQIFKSKR